MRKKIILLFVLSASMLLLFCACGKNDNDVKFYYPDNMTKVLRDEVPDEDGSVKPLFISLAGNEYEGQQFVVNCKNELTNLKVTVDSLKNEDGDIFPSENISVYRQYYMYYNLDDLSWENEQGIEPSEEGWYPNALIPMFDGSDGGQKNDEYNVSAGDNQGYWITAYASEDTKPGKYTGVITVSYNDQKIEMPIDVEIWNFKIPEKSTLETIFGYGPGATTEWYQHFYPDLELNYTEINNQYKDYLRKFRIDVESDVFKYKTDEEYIEKIKSELELGKTKHYRLSFEYDPNDTVEQLVEKNINKYKKYADAGILQYAYVSNVDEPHNEEMFAEVNKTQAALKAMNLGNIRYLVTHGYKKDVLEDVTLWVPTSPCMSREFVWKQRSLGNDVMWYGYQYVSEKKMNDLHFTFWMSSDYDVGHLNWSTNMFKKFDVKGSEADSSYIFRNVWEDVSSFSKSTENGYYIFPGAEGDGIVDRNIPIGTMMLESIRDGLEEYEYFSMLKSRYSSYIDNWKPDISLDDIMYSYYYPSITGFGNKYASADTSHTVNVRYQAAQDILNETQAIVAVKRAVNTKYKFSRDVVVYTPDDAEVIIDGKTVQGSDIGKCKKYTLPIDASDERIIQVSVNGKIYNRYIIPETDNEYGDLVKNTIYKSCDNMGFSLDEKINAGEFLENQYMSEEFNLDSDSSIRSLKLESIDSMSHAKIPLTMTYEDINENYKLKKVKICVPKETTISIDNTQIGQPIDMGSYNEYIFNLDVGQYPCYLLKIEVSNSNVTEEQKLIIHQAIGNNKNLIDFNNANEAIKKITSNSPEFYNISNNILELKMGSGALLSFMFDKDCMSTSDFSDFTHLRLIIRNNSDKVAKGIEVSLYGSSFSKIIGNTGSIDPNTCQTVDINLPDYGKDKMSQISSLSLAPLSVDFENQQTDQYSVEGIYLVKKQ